MSEYSKETDVNEWLRFVQMDKDAAEHMRQFQKSDIGHAELVSASLKVLQDKTLK